MNIRAMVIAFIGGPGPPSAVNAFAAPPSKMAVDLEKAHYAQTMLDEVGKNFRCETLGSEAFWGDTLQLHKAIAG